LSARLPGFGQDRPGGGPRPHGACGTQRPPPQWFAEVPQVRIAEGKIIANPPTMIEDEPTMPEDDAG